jgi:hypothetical protein
VRSISPPAGVIEGTGTVVRVVAGGGR